MARGSAETGRASPVMLLVTWVWDATATVAFAEGSKYLVRARPAIDRTRRVCPEEAVFSLHPCDFRFSITHALRKRRSWTNCLKSLLLADPGICRDRNAYLRSSWSQSSKFILGIFSTVTTRRMIRAKVLDGCPLVWVSPHHTWQKFKHSMASHSISQSTLVS